MSSVVAPAPPGSAPTPAPGAFARPAVVVPVVATVAAVALALVVWQNVYQEIRGDARGYYELAVQLVVNGPAGVASTFRTYGYPAFLALLIPFVGTEAEDVRSAAFVVQLALFLVAAWYGARRLGRALGAPALWPWIFAATACNPFMLIHSIQMLTDVLSATLVYVAVVASIPTETEAEARAGADRRTGWPWRTVLVAMAVMACGGLLVMIRPPNALVLPLLLLAWLVRTVRYRQVPWAAWPLLLALLVLPFVPQALVNQRAYGTLNPLMVVTDQYEANSIRAMRLAKYATVSIAGIPAQLHYANPFGPEQDLPPFQFLRQDPLRFAATMVIRTFALVDQDQPFTYIYDLTPWYRWPLAVPNYLFLLAGIVGLCWPARGAGPERSRYRRTLFVLVLAMASIWAMYAVTNIESRYSLPVYPLLAAPAVIAVVRLREATAGRAWLLAATLAGALLWVGILAATSEWIDRQSPMIVATRAAVAAPPPSPAAAYAPTVPDEWEAGQRVTIPVRVTNVGSDTWNPAGYFPVVVRAQFVALKTEQHRQLPRGARTYLNLPAAVPPGGSAEVTATLETPSATGRYVLEIAVIRNGIDETHADFERQVRVDRRR